ncbi:MAG: choice-of-anchor D domain-containing protein [Candidatus Hydrogenedentes bacterium]|nr:choice-of-anchor D domain-containing protein [Candidatus Hydrogenedentota bacterium]
MGLDVLVPEAMQSVEFSNTGNWPLRIDSYEFLGQDAGDFRLASGDALSFVEPGQTHEIQVVFQPSATGARTATLRVHYHDGVEPGQADIPLTGNGI